MPAIAAMRPGGATAAPSRPEAPRATRHFAFDLETGDAREDDIELACALVKPASNIKDPEKVQENLATKRAKIAEKAALMDAAPIASAAFVTEAEKVIFYHRGYPWGKFTPVKAIKGFGGTLVCEKDERGMLLVLRDWMDARSVLFDKEEQATLKKRKGSILICHNLFGFDLPKLRLAYIRNELRLPEILDPEAVERGAEYYDTMKHFLRYFTTENAGDQFISVEAVGARLGLPQYKAHMSGADVPKAVREGKALDVLTYNGLDALEHYAFFRSMTGLNKNWA